MARLKSANAAVKDAANVVKNKLARDIIDVAKLGDNVHTGLKNMIPNRERLMVTNTGDRDLMSAENTHLMENKVKDILSRIDGVNLEGTVKGSGKINQIDVGKTDIDLLREKWNVPETETVAVGKTDVPG
jgi:hypothetical protein